MILEQFVSAMIARNPWLSEDRIISVRGTQVQALLKQAYEQGRIEAQKQAENTRSESWPFPL